VEREGEREGEREAGLDRLQIRNESTPVQEQIHDPLLRHVRQASDEPHSACSTWLPDLTEDPKCLTIKGAPSVLHSSALYCTSTPAVCFTAWNQQQRQQRRRTQLSVPR